MTSELDDTGRPPIKVTDKRRIRDDDEAGAPAEQAGATPGPDVQETDDDVDVARDIDAARAEAAEYLDHLR